MGKRGPPKTPSETLSLRGSWRAKDRDASTAEVRIPPCPGWLAEDAAMHWDHFAGLLLPMRLIGDAFADGVVVLCTSLAEYIRVRKEAMETPYTYETERGPTMHPIHRVHDMAFNRFIKALSHFGLTPASLASVKTLGVGDTKAADYKLKA